MTWTVGDVVSVLVPAIGALAWLMKLHGRQNTLEVQHNGLKEDVDEVRDDVKYIRERIDRALNGR